MDYVFLRIVIVTHLGWVQWEIKVKSYIEIIQENILKDKIERF